LLFSPALIIFRAATALAAPIAEEFAKALGLLIFGRRRLTSERQTRLVGLALRRGFGAVLHPVRTALVALGWFRVPQRGYGQLLRAYALAVALHTLWNGGFVAVIYLTGLDYHTGAGEVLSLCGTAVGWLQLIFLGCWRSCCGAGWAGC